MKLSIMFNDLAPLNWSRQQIILLDKLNPYSDTKTNFNSSKSMREVNIQQYYQWQLSMLLSAHTIDPLLPDSRIAASE